MQSHHTSHYILVYTGTRLKAQIHCSPDPLLPRPRQSYRKCYFHTKFVCTQLKSLDKVYFRSHMCFNCSVDLGLGLRLVLGFYYIRHLMNGWDLKYTFSDNYNLMKYFLIILNDPSPYYASCAPVIVYGACSREV